ncbi:hypothetical protein ACFL2H_03780 [Planctomycetota bacterium]
MSQEILFTSASEGLKSESHGFCTVVSTFGMAKNLAQRLESLTGYRHHYMPHDEKSHLNPVDFSHVRFRVGGQTFHVLSRICDAGLDYSGRTNKLAHLVALKPSELAAAVGGPAWAMLDEQFFTTQWDGQVRTVPMSRTTPRTDDCPPAICRTWGQLTGDAGWAGVLAESAKQAGQPMSVIFGAGTDVLSLVVEALALLPSRERWKVTFSTYFTKLPAGVDCQWRFLLNEGEEATKLRRNPRAQYIDLCSTLGTAAGGPFVDSARTGKSVPTSAEPVQESRQIAVERSPRRQVIDEAEALLEPVRSQPALPQGSQANAPEKEYKRFERPRDQSSLLRKLLFVAYTMALLLIGFSVGYLLSRPAEAPFEQVSDVRNSPPVTTPPSTETDEFTSNADPKPEKLTTNEHVEPAPKKTIEETEESPKPPPIDPIDDEVTSKGDEEISTPFQPEPFADIKQKKRRLVLPSIKDNTHHDLAEVYIGDPSQLELDVRGALFEGNNATIHRSEKGGEVSWTIKKKAAGPLARDTLLGEFTLRDGMLGFKWLSQINENEHLKYCLLQLAVGKEQINSTLNAPISVKPIRVSMDKTEQFHKRLLPANLELKARPSISFWCTGLTPGKEPRRNELDGKQDSTGVFSFKVGDAGKRPPVNREVHVEINDLVSKNMVRIRCFAMAETIKDNGDPDYSDVTTDKRIVGTEEKVSMNDALSKLLKMCSAGAEKLELDRTEREDTQRKLQNQISGWKKELNEEDLEESRRLRIKAKIDDKKEQINLIEIMGKRQELFTKNKKWCETVKTFCHEIQRDLRIHYEIFITVDSVQIPIQTTR